MSIGIILHEPEQPGNAGAIGRTCLCLGASLHLIRPLGFMTSDRFLKRAGLDYWPRLNPTEYDNFEEFRAAHPGARVWFLTTKAHQTISDVEYRDGDFLMFGKESAGIPEELLAPHPEMCVRIPMAEGERSLNLAASCAIALYEAERQLGYKDLIRTGELHRLHFRR
ncbi:MAG: tRNA (cytidine(34)-2'-O)-methyltransferase [Lachnospiraceae bacterium]|nr:tRNA (cytidine(34)-2'-O)-methyltransferase [Lachnospiraceae bacterium]